MNVDIRWQHGDQDRLCTAGNIRQRLRIDRRRRVDDDPPGLRRHAHLPAPGHPHLIFVGRYAVNDRKIAKAFVEPVHARTLPIHIHQRRFHALGRKIGRQVGGNRGFSGSAFRIQHDDLFHQQTIRQIWVRQQRFSALCIGEVD